MLRFSLVALQTAVLLSCTVIEQEPAELTTTEAIATPSVVDWVPGRVPARALFPDRVLHLNTVMTRGDRTGTFLAWGIGDGDVLWIFRVTNINRSDFLDKLADGWMIQETPGSTKSHCISGSVSAPPPRHPPVPGEPEFSTAYVARITGYAWEQEELTGDVLGDLGGL